MNDLERLLSKIDTDGPTGCWLWSGARNAGGYGQFWKPDVDRSVRGGQMRPAHRCSYELLVGPIPTGLEIDHLCRNRACVNPDHLEPVTRLENVRRGRQGAPQRERTHCPHGHPYDGDNLYIRPHGAGRTCKECRRVSALRRYHRLAADRKARLVVAA